MESLYLEVFLAVNMAFFGCLNTLCATWANKKGFDHIFFLAECRFIGECLCLVVFLFAKCCCKGILRQEPTEEVRNEQHRRRQRIERLTNQQQLRRGNGVDCDDDIGNNIQAEINELRQEPDEPKLNPFVFLPAAIFDMLSTGVMYMGLNLTFWSSAQMLRGALVLFTALLSVAFLGRKTKLYEWFAMFFIIGGLLVVGGGDFKIGENKNIKPNGIVAGDLLIVMALIILSVRMVYEERFVNRYNVHPLLGVGLEGIFGTLILGVLLVPFYYIDVGTFSANNENTTLEDTIKAFHQVIGDKWLMVAVIGNMVTYGVYNFVGLSVTKAFHAKTRVVYDSQKYLIVWVVSLGLKWKKFHYLQVIGYLLLIFGLSIYWRLLTCSRLRAICKPCGGNSERQEPVEQVVANEEPEERRPLLGAESSASYDRADENPRRPRNSVV